MPTKLLVLVLAAGFLVGCDPAPSTKLAPDVPAPDASKFSQSDISKFKESENRDGNPPR